MGGSSAANSRSASRTDDDEDDRPVRRRRRSRGHGNDAAVRTISGALIALGILGLLTLVVFFVGAFLLFRTASNSMQQAQREHRQAAQESMDRANATQQAAIDAARQPAAGAPAGFVPPTPPAPPQQGFNPPGFTPSVPQPPPPGTLPPDTAPNPFQPGGPQVPRGPGFPAQPNFPPAAPNVPQQPGGFPQPPGGMPRPEAPTAPVSPQQPGKVPGPGDAPRPPGAAADVNITLSNLRRVQNGFAIDELEVDYEVTAGVLNPGRDFILVKTARGTGEVRLGAGAKVKGTVRLKAVGIDKLKGEVEVWMERKGFGPPGAKGVVISNTVKLE